MVMHTEKYCTRLETIDPAAAIRAIHQAHIQLAAISADKFAPGELDNAPALESLWEVLRAVGYAGAYSETDPAPGSDAVGEGIKGINVRFFAHTSTEDGPDIVEITESDFLALGEAISYERNTVFANGVRQICLTSAGCVDEE